MHINRYNKVFAPIFGYKNSEKFNAGTDSILVKGALLVGMYLTLNCNMQMRILSTDLEIMKRTRQLEN